MSTDKGQNFQAVIWLVMSAVTAMDTGTDRTVLLALGMVIMAIVAWRTTGSCISSTETKEILDASKSLQAILGEARED